MFDAPVVSVHLPPVMRSLAAGHDEVTASGDTVGEVLEAVFHEYPAIRGQVCTENGEVRAGLCVYLGARSVSELQGLATPVGQEERLSLIPAPG